MSFLETPRFPTDISYGSKGGPAFNTTIISIKSGDESRNINWTYPKFEGDVSYGIKNMPDLYSLNEFFHAMRGMGHGFRYKDWSDYKSCSPNNTVADTDQTIGVGDASEDEFQLIKNYTRGAINGVRIIKKPVSGTVVVSINDVTQSSGWSVDTATGIITFTSPPGNGLNVKAGYEFDVPCRFDTDSLSISLDFYSGGGTSVPIVELKNP